jgi:hypothetical protein
MVVEVLLPKPVPVTVTTHALCVVSNAWEEAVTSGMLSVKVKVSLQTESAHTASSDSLRKTLTLAVAPNVVSQSVVSESILH